MDLLNRYDTAEIPLDVEFKIGQEKKKDTIPGIEVSMNIPPSPRLADVMNIFM